MRLDQYRENKQHDLTNLYVAAGDRTYVIGTQDGLFPDLGGHVQDEMGGIWNHPIKLMDGYWLQISDERSTQWLEHADEFTNYPFYNEFSYNDLQDLQIDVVRRQFCPDGLEGVIVSYQIMDKRQDGDRVLNLSFLGRTDLSPVWLSERVNKFDGEDHGILDHEESIFIGNDSLNPWFVVFGADRPFQQGVVDKQLFGPETTAGAGVSGLLTYENVALASGGTTEIQFFIAGSYQSEEAAKHTFTKLRNEHITLFNNKKYRYEGMLNQTDISIPDKQLEYVFNWVKFNNDWLIREVPEIGRGLGAGYPEYPWWFGCDNSYALHGVLPLGQFQLAQDTLDLIRGFSEQQNDKGIIIHEISTCGASYHMFDRSNTQETPHFIKCAWETFLWSGDIVFLQSVYPAFQKGIHWLLEEKDPDGDLLPEGYGVMEIEGLNLELIDSAVYTYEALRVASLAAELLGEPDQAQQYSTLAEKLKATINRDLWLDEEGVYGDVVGTPAMILPKMDDYIENVRNKAGEQAAQDMTELKEQMMRSTAEEERAWLFKNWVINTPMEVGIAPREQAIRALNRMETDEFTGPWGTYLSGPYRKAMMTISTGVSAVAECRYDRMDEALRYVNLISSTFNQFLPGSISEMSPNYGCFVQAWTVYGMVTPIISYMFGIQPRAYWKEVTLRPRLPHDWNDVSVKRVAIGGGEDGNELSFFISRTINEEVYRFSLSQAGWTIKLKVACTEGVTILLDGVEISIEHIEDEAIITVPDSRMHEVRVIRA
jgi:glycogen debranching enzyme